MRCLKFVVCACALIGSSANAESKTASASDSTSANLQRHVGFLADDRLEGRGPGKPGYDIAAQYVRSNFESIGLQPLIRGDYLQRVPLVERTPAPAKTDDMVIGQRRFPLGEMALANLSGEGKQTWTGEAVFIGYGLVSPRHGIDDYAGSDVRGKVVAYYNRVPSTLDETTAQGLIRDRAAAAHARGAVGMIALVDDASFRTSWKDWRSDFAFPYFNWLQPDGTPFRIIPMRVNAALSPEAASELFSGAPQPFAAIRQLAEKGEALPSFPLSQRVTISSNNSWRRYSSANVIGMIPGTDPKLAQEYIVVTAHLDHLGSDPSVEGNDKIFNGALDNASGVAVAIEVGRGLAQRPMRRPVIIAAVTAEETGLLGSDYLAERGLPGGGKTVAAINVDGGVPTYNLSEVSAFGGSHSTLGTAFDAIAEKAGFKPLPDGLAPTDFFERSDHYSFARRGIPAVFVAPRANDKELATYRPHVHQPSDDLRLPFNWSAGARFTNLIQQYVTVVANAPEVPSWYSDSPFLGRLTVRPQTVPRAPN